MDNKTEVERVDCALDAFENNIGIPKFSVNFENEVEKYLNIDINEKLTPEEYAQAAFILSRFSLYLQRCCNKESAKIFYLEERIKKIIAPRFSQQSQYAKADEKRMLAIREDDVASKLEDERIKIQLRLIRINGLTWKVDSLAEKFTELSRVFRKRVE